MAQRIIPVDAKRADWPRLVAQRLNGLPNFAELGDFVDDTAAATGGVEIGKLYRTGSIVKVRVA